MVKKETIKEISDLTVDIDYKKTIDNIIHDIQTAKNNLHTDNTKEELEHIFEWLERAMDTLEFIKYLR